MPSTSQITTCEFPYKTSKTLTFANSSGALNLFTVTGDVAVRITAVCATDLASAAAGSVSVGISGTTDAIMPATTATDLDAREIWHDNAPDSEIEATGSAYRDYVIADGDDIILTCSAQIDSGVLEFVCEWRPLSSGASVIAA
jgi:hypothetical protein